MQIRMVKMFTRGVEVERRMLNDRSTQTYRGNLVISDVTDQGRHRVMKVARLMSMRGVECELLDVSVVWANDGRITFAGDERLPDDGGQLVNYKQSWLCTLDTSPPAEGDIKGPDRKFKLPPR